MKQHVTSFALLSLTLLFLTSIGRGAVIPGSETVNPANGHTYYLLSTATWMDSEAEAVSLGGHLVTINDAAEQEWVFDTFGNFNSIGRTLWLGLYQEPGSIEPDQGWNWISGEPVTYTNWETGSPDNFEGNQHFAYMYYQGDGTWDDGRNDNAFFFNPSGAGVVEVVPSPASAVLLLGGVCAFQFRRRKS